MSHTKDGSYRPFSNGTEYHMWQERNCCRGEKGCRNYKPEATSSKNGCPIEVAIVMASCLDGTISNRIALRGGFLVPGPDGLLVENEPGTIVACPEYRGYDEPDDRPRRGPRPAPGQIDLLDPRPIEDQIRSVR
jgi:hypothetical protein